MNRNRKILNRIKYVLLTSILFYSSSCQSSYVKSSPAIYVKNSSSRGGLVRNVKIAWNGYNLLDISGPINVCGGGGLTQSFNIQHESDFFGPVHVEWENAKGQKLIKDFIFKKEDLPSYKYRHESRVDSYVTLYFTQSDVEYYTSDNPNIKKIKEEKSGNWINKWFEEEGRRRCVNDPKETKRLKELAKRTTYCVNDKKEKIDCDNLYRKFYYDENGKVKELKQ